METPAGKRPTPQEQCPHPISSLDEDDICRDCAPLVSGGTQGGTAEEVRGAAAAFGWCALGCLIGLLAALAGYWWVVVTR